jgi:hypothetical protein
MAGELAGIGKKPGERLVFSGNDSNNNNGDDENSKCS